VCIAGGLPDRITATSAFGVVGKQLSQSCCLCWSAESVVDLNATVPGSSSGKPPDLVSSC